MLERLRRRSSLVNAIVVVAVVAGWMLFLRPASLGGPLSLVIVSGQSMEPTMHTGDLAVVLQRDTYAAGDVVAFRPQLDDAGASSSMVIHRIVDGTTDSGFTTQGDGNEWLDPWTTPEGAIAGEMAFFVPRVGHVLARLSDPVTLAALFAAVTVFLVLAPSREKEPDDESPPTTWTAQAAS